MFYNNRFFFTVSYINKKKKRGKYKSKTVDINVKHEGKIKIVIPDDINRVVVLVLKTLLITLVGS